MQLWKLESMDQPGTCSSAVEFAAKIAALKLQSSPINWDVSLDDKKKAL